VINRDPVCGVTIVHKETVERVRQALPGDETLFELADFFKVFGDSTRIKVLQALYHSELCVCDLASILGASQSAVSHQLKTLRMSNLVKYRRDGKLVYYSLSDEHVGAILGQGLVHIKERT
jgi:ArsR family transcriptional regulator